MGVSVGVSEGVIVEVGVAVSFVDGVNEGEGTKV